MAEELWAKINSRNEIMNVAESLIPYFKSRKKDEKGNSARFVSVQDVNFDQVLMGDVNNIKLKVKLLSDQGGWTHDLIIREFKDEDILTDEINRYNELERRVLIFDNIFPSPLIHIDKERKQLIYEYKTGEKFRELQLDDELKDYQIGRIFAMIQGEFSNPLDGEKMRALFTYMINSLPFQPEEKENIAMLLEPHYYILPNSLGGYQPCTLFDPANIEFTKLVDEDITKQLMKENKALFLTIPLQQPEDMIVDRMADVASFYIRRVFTEFIETGSVENVKNLILSFFEGYNSVSKEIGTPNLEELYPHGITLDIQLLLVFWILKYTEISKKIDNAWNKDSLRFTYFLLLKKPFLLF